MARSLMQFNGHSRQVVSAWASGRGVRGRFRSIRIQETTDCAIALEFARHSAIFSSVRGSFARGCSTNYKRSQMKHFLYLVAFTAMVVALAGCNKQSSIVGPPSSGSSSWSQVTGLTSFFNMAMSGQVIYAAGNSGVFRSNDGGGTWTEVDTTLPSGGYTIAASNGRLFIGDYYNYNGVFVSSDSGSTWVAADSGLESSFPGVYRIILSITAADSAVFAGTSSNGVFKSTDNGKSWRPANSGIGYGSSVYSLAVAGPNLVAGTQSGTYLSSDGGGSWIANDSGLVNLSPYYSGLPAVASLFVEGSKLYAGAYGAQVYLSYDNGMSWADISGNLPGSAQSGIGIAAVDTSLVVVDDGGVFLSTNDGSSWANIQGNLPTTGIYSFDEANGYVFVQLNDGSVWRRPI